IVQRQPPVARDKSYQVTLGDTLVVDAAHGVKANDTDAEGDPMTPTVQSGPSKGQLQFNADGSFTYTFTGYFPPKRTLVTDSFTYVERDQDGSSNVATVRINVVRPDSGGDRAVSRSTTTAIGARAQLLDAPARNGRGAPGLTATAAGTPLKINAGTGVRPGPK